MEDATEPPNQNPRLIVTGEGEQSLPVFPGQRVVKVNGTYLQSNELRNGKHCYSKIEREKKDLEKESSSSSSHQVEEQVEGGIYFLRGYWRLCEIGIGEDVIGWDYRFSNIFSFFFSFPSSFLGGDYSLIILNVFSPANYQLILNHWNLPLEDGFTNEVCWLTILKRKKGLITRS